METPISGERRLKFAHLPRSRSTSSMLVSTGNSLSASGDGLHGGGLERKRAGVDSLREFAEFLRTTGPHSSTTVSSESRLSTYRPNDTKRWSIKSLRKEWRAKTYVQPTPHLPHNTAPGKTIDGHHYVAISIPNRYEHLSRSRSQSSSAHLERPATHQEWPERTSSRRGRGCPLTTDISSGTRSLIIRSDSLQLRQYSVGEAGRPTALRCDLAAQDEQTSVDHALVDGDADALQKPKGNLEYSPAPTSHQGLSPDLKTTTQSTPTAPFYPFLPESPGFPKMLATMDFPSPPMHCGSSSPDRRIDCVASLRIRPRTSSKRAPTSNNGTPPASLDEVVMQSSCPVPPHLGPSDDSPTSKSIATTGVVMQNAVAMTGTTQEIEYVKSQSSSDTSSASIEARCDSVTSMASDNASSMKQSLLSNIPTIASSPSTPPATNESYNLVIRDPVTGEKPCDSAASEAPLFPKVPISHHHTCPVSGSNLITAQPSLAESSTWIESTLQSCKPKSNCGNAMDKLTLIPTSREEGSRRSIVERRIARKTKVQAYKRRDIDTTRLFVNTTTPASANLKSNDSPILGWFTNISCPRKLPIKSNGLVLSPVMNTEIRPGGCSSYNPDPLETVNEIGISPIMVIADVGPQDESSTLLESTVYSPTGHQPSRPALKHRLKIMTQSRPKSIPVMIHRNPATGDIERSMSAAGKCNRHSLTSFPQSPNSSSLKRRSNPVGTIKNDSYESTPASILFGSAASDVTEAVPREADFEIYNNFRIGLRKERLQKEKLFRDQEISKLVAETLRASNTNEEPKEDLEEEAIQEMDKQLEKLEQNGDAWLQVVKSLLNNMSKTLEDIRGNNEIGRAHV